MLLREGCVPWPSGEIPGGVAGVVSSELTMGYESVFAGDSAIRNVRFRLQDLLQARSDEMGCRSSRVHF